MQQMESAILNRNTASGCTQEATKTNSKTAKIRNIASAATEVTRSCCSSSSSNISSSSHNNSRKISSQRPLTLLLITMTLATLATHLPGSANAAAIASSSSSSSAEASAEEQQTLLDSLDTALQLAQHVQQQHNADRARRTRLRKRHTNHFYFHQHPHESDTELEWQNPCGGTFVGRAEEGDEQFQRQSMKQHLKDLRNAVRHQYTNAEFYTEIQIDDMDTWQAHKNLYKFLPHLKPNSSITLKRWYRNMQTFVASFAYLGRTQYNWDRKQLQKASPISHELNALFSSARMLLCEIETAINGSYPQSSQSKLTAISRAAMNRRLRFRTRAYAQQASGAVEVRDVDLKYAKHYYIDYVKQMLRVLRKNSKRAHKSRATSAAASFEDADLSMNSALVDDSGSLQSSSESVELLNAAESTTSRSGSKRAPGHRGGQKWRQQQHPRKNINQE